MGERGRPKYPDVLTPRQYEVLELVREGLTNPQIAERLGISPDGAKWHVKEILWKLDLPSREEAARWAGERREATPSARLRLDAGPWRPGRGRRSGRCRFRRPVRLSTSMGGASALSLENGAKRLRQVSSLRSE